MLYLPILQVVDKMEPHPSDWQHSQQCQTQTHQQQQPAGAAQLGWSHQIAHPVVQQNSEMYPTQFQLGLPYLQGNAPVPLVSQAPFFTDQPLQSSSNFSIQQPGLPASTHFNHVSAIQSGNPAVIAQSANGITTASNGQMHSGDWTQSQPYQQPISALHKSFSFGNILAQAQQSYPNDEMRPQPLNPQCQQASTSGLPSTFLFGAQNAIQTRPRMARSSSFADATSTSSGNPPLDYNTMSLARPFLSVTTDGSMFGPALNASSGPNSETSMQSSDLSIDNPAASYANYHTQPLQPGEPTHREAASHSHFSDSTAGDSLNPEPADLESYNSRNTYSVGAVTYTSVDIEARRASLFGQPIHESTASRSVSSSIPSTPDLSRQQSNSSFRSPSTEYSQFQGSFATPTDGQVLSLDVQQSDRNEQPIPDLSSVHLKEKTPALDTWTRLNPRPENDDEANALLK